MFRNTVTLVGENRESERERERERQRQRQTDTQAQTEMRRRLCRGGSTIVAEVVMLANNNVFRNTVEALGMLLVSFETETETDLADSGGLPAPR